MGLHDYRVSFRDLYLLLDQPTWEAAVTSFCYHGPMHSSLQVGPPWQSAASQSMSRKKDLLQLLLPSILSQQLQGIRALSMVKAGALASPSGGGLRGGNLDLFH